MDDLRDAYVVERVPRSDCADLILRVHYARRWPSVSYAFGLFKHGALIGVVTYGTPPSAPLRSGLAGAAYAKHVVELNRLVLYENEKNAASRLVSGSLRLLRRIGDFIVISFADTDQGHLGVVYQAASFSYRGLSAKRTNWKVRGMEHLHGQTVADMARGAASRAEALRARFGDAFFLAPRSRKHRYVKVIGSKGFCAKAKNAIRYPELPYPKKERAA